MSGSVPGVSERSVGHAVISDAVLYPGGSGHRGVCVWQWSTPTTALSSAAVGGGLRSVDYLLNTTVATDYDRTDLGTHMAEIANELALSGNGIGLFTAVNVAHSRRHNCEGVVVDGTVGVSKPTWASDPAGGFTEWTPGTINLVVQLPVALTGGAAVNAVTTATEAKTQALLDCKVPGTGTASDAVVVTWPSLGEAQPFAGPRSEWGARIAQAAYAAVKVGVEDWTGRHVKP